MDQMLEKLKERGADIDGAMRRFLDDVDLYKTCFATFLEDEAFQKLGEALQAADYEKAFEYAHTLKGVTGNMGLTPLYQVICDMVTDLRKQDYSRLQDYYVQVMEWLDRLKELY